MAMLKVLLDIYAAFDRQQVTLLNLLYLSWAFDLAVKYHDIVLRVPSLVYVDLHSQQQMLSFLRGSTLNVFCGGLYCCSVFFSGPY